MWVRRPDTWWADYHNWNCGYTTPVPSGGNVTRTYWIDDLQVCAEFIELVDECAVDDPHVKDCSEAPFDCCGLPSAYDGGPLCPL